MGNSDPKTRLKEIIDSYLNKDGGGMIDTGIVASHLAQMKLFGIRQGVEFFPAQDNFGNQRKDFVDLTNLQVEDSHHIFVFYCSFSCFLSCAFSL